MPDQMASQASNGGLTNMEPAGLNVAAVSAKPKETSKTSPHKTATMSESDKNIRSKQSKPADDALVPDEWGHHAEKPSDRSRCGRINGHHQVAAEWPAYDPVLPSRSNGGIDQTAAAGGMFVPSDDMENYFNANAGLLHDDDDDGPVVDEVPDWGHSLQNYDVYDSWIANQHTNQHLADEGVGLYADEQYFCDVDNDQKAYLSEEYLGAGSLGQFQRCNSNDSLYNHCEDDIYQTNISNSMEDLGDFIEADMPKGRYGCESTDSSLSRSRTPSDEDLPTLALDANSQVTGSGDIRGALSLNWNQQYNIELARRPPTLVVSGRSGTLPSDSSGAKPRTGSDTDYGFFTPTSCVSESSLRTQSVQSPQLSDNSGPGAVTSTESSTFASPETEQVHLAVNNAHFTQNSTVPKRSPVCEIPCAKPRPRSDGHIYANDSTGIVDLDNLDTVSVKTAKDKNIDMQPCTSMNHSLDRRRRKKRHNHSCHDNQSSLVLPACFSPTRRSHSLCTFEHNNLNPESFDDRLSQTSDQFNVSRQTSTSDFDQDENSFQEVVDSQQAADSSSDCELEDAVAFQKHVQECCSFTDCACSENRGNKWSTPDRIPRNRLSRMSESDPGPVDRDSIENLLQGMCAAEISENTYNRISNANCDDLPLPPQTPILNRQLLKKAAKYLDYNFLYKNFFKDQSESDSDEDSPYDGGIINELDLVGAPESTHTSSHMRGHKMLYTVLLKDALLNHLQGRSAQYKLSPIDGSSDVKKVMLWTEYQAYVLQVSQIGTSACGATAVINVLKYFDVYIEQERVCEVIKTNLRAETAPIPGYLLSRSVAGTTANELIDGIHKLTNGAIYGRFFPMFPERDINISQWLGSWIEKGAVPMVTLNRQRAIPQGWVVPDAWHHQMVYGVGPKGVYLTNPLEIVPEYVIQNQLCSESVLLVRRNDVVSRWSKGCNLGILLQQPDTRWRDMNVLGQVVNVLREDQTSRVGAQCPQLMSHISIPAWYKSGITLYVRRDTDLYQQLISTNQELPLKSETVQEVLACNKDSDTVSPQQSTPDIAI